MVVCWKLLVLLVCTLAATGCSTSTEEPDFRNPFDPILGAGIPLPDSVRVTVGDNFVTLKWSLPSGESADEYAVFRRRIALDDFHEEFLLDRVASPQYSDTRVQNGRSYVYRIAAGVGGQFGRRTDEIAGNPGLHSIVVSSNGNQHLTGSRNVSVSFTAPGAEAIQLSENESDFSQPWQSVSSTVSVILSAPDGPKTIYARFRFPDGAESNPVSDSILLDTKAVIEEVDFDGNELRGPGEPIHFKISTGEKNGSATISVADLFTNVPLFDDGSSGDETANDGIYERLLSIPSGSAALNASVVGRFTDEAGNAATDVTALKRLTVQKLPNPVEIISAVAAEAPASPSVQIRWNPTNEERFSSYTVFRSQSAAVDSTDKLLTTVASRTTTEHTDTDVIEGITYYYRVYVQDSSDLQSGSNIAQAFVENTRNPAAVTLSFQNEVSETRAALHWTKSTDRDFKAYRVYRNTSGAVTEADQLVADISNVDVVFHDDDGLTENVDYYYRLYVYDTADLFSRSEEIKARTKNEAPPSVALEAAADIDTTAATLIWAESSAHDFKSYKLFRDEVPTVTTSSTLVVEIDEIESISFRDVELEPAQRYYYRVFVFDEGTDSKSTGSNTISFETAESSGIVR